MHELHKEISDRIEQSNLNYKLRAYVTKKFKTFNVGDYVMVRIHVEWFSSETLKSCMLVMLKLLKSEIK